MRISWIGWQIGIYCYCHEIASNNYELLIGIFMPWTFKKLKHVAFRSLSVCCLFLYLFRVAFFAYCDPIKLRQNDHAGLSMYHVIYLKMWNKLKYLFICFMNLLSCVHKIYRPLNTVTNVNFRMYALRRIKDGFRQHKNETDATKIQELLKDAQQNFEIIHRQVIIHYQLLFNVCMACVNFLIGYVKLSSTPCQCRPCVLRFW